MPAAAQGLKITVSTLFRRLEKIEETIGASLFTRDRGHYVANELGQELVLAAERMEQEAAQGERRLTGKGQNVKGRVRVASSELLAPLFLARHLGHVAVEHPGLLIDVLSGNQMVSLSDGDADVALRPMRPTDPQLFGRKLTDISWAIYGPRDADPEVNPFGVGLTGEIAAQLPLQLQTDILGVNDISIFANSLMTAAKLAEQGGHCILPMILGAQSPNLRRLSPPINERKGELWIICHTDLQRNPRVRVVFDVLIEAAAKDRHLFRGDAVPTTSANRIAAPASDGA
jgi:DNA-binding transcriptional LysR family regulator